METNLKFNSAICTSREQSERLLELGLKKETADCMYSVMTREYNGRYILEEDRQYHLCLFYQEEVQSVGFSHYEHIPAWSMHRLIEILGPHRLPIHFRKKGRVDITTSYINQACSGRSGYNYYDSIIDCIAWLINEGYDYFNQDYLEEKA